MSYSTYLLRLSFLCVACTYGAEFTAIPPLQAGEAVDMAVDGDGRVFLSAGSGLFRLDRDLALSEDVTVDSPILQIALSTDGSRLVACFSDESCAVYDAGNFSAGQLLSVQQASASALNLALFTSPNDTFYVGSEGSLPGLSNAVYLTQYGIGASSFVRSSGTDFDVQTSGFDRLFAGGFTHGMYAYYLAFDSTNLDLAVRILRVCDVDSCGSGQCDFATLYEAELPCGILSAGQTICEVSLVENFLDSPDPTVVYSICGPRNHICSVPLASIDAEINATYSACSAPGSTQRIEVVWDQTGGAPLTCSSVGSFVSECEHDPPLALNNFDEIVTSILYNLDSDSSVDELTATLVITVDGITLLYAGYSDGSEHFVAALQVQGTATVESFSGALYSANTSHPVRKLHWREGLDNVYAASEDAVFLIPLLTDCLSCTVYSNPLYGWCTVEQKCSKQSECQNSTEPLRWITLDGASSSEEVCPLLLPPTTPTGDYLQPVLIDRDLELVTRNLPQPPSAEFRYECILGTSPPLRLHAVYNNETSVTCLVAANQISLPVGSGQEVVEILLEWVRDSDSLGRAVDTQGRVQINTTLYNCAELGNTCSVCLAANTDTAFDCAWCGDNSTCDVENECSGSPTTMFPSCATVDDDSGDAVAVVVGATVPLLVIAVATAALGLSC